MSRTLDIKVTANTSPANQQQCWLHEYIFIISFFHETEKRFYRLTSPLWRLCVYIPNSLSVDWTQLRSNLNKHGGNPFGPPFHIWRAKMDRCDKSSLIKDDGKRVERQKKEKYSWAETQTRPGYYKYGLSSDLVNLGDQWLQLGGPAAIPTSIVQSLLKFSFLGDKDVRGAENGAANELFLF